MTQPTITQWTAFWKGTPLHFERPMTRKEIKKLTSPGGLMLKQLDGLYADGLSKKEIIQLLTQQLDDIEEKLRAGEKAGLFVPEVSTQHETLHKVFGADNKVVSLWFMNIACLLHMKAIKDDDMHGWLVKEIHETSKGPVAVCYPAGLCLDGETVDIFAPKL